MPRSWVQDIVSALENLGGTAHYGDLYEEVSKIRGGELPRSWQAIIRQSVESHSSDSRNSEEMTFSTLCEASVAVIGAYSVYHND
jgi:hypothetical protein